MKFLCPNCKAKYQISDEKIAGRTLKMDCRRCNHPIVIRGNAGQAAGQNRARRASQSQGSLSSPARRPTGSGVGPMPARSSRSALGSDFRRQAAAPPPPQRPTALDQWHVSINDVPVGPMKRDEVANKMATGAIKPDSLCWREGFDDWREVGKVPELAALMRRARPAAPPPPKPMFPSPPRPLGRTGSVRPARPPSARMPAAPARSQSARPAARASSPAPSNVVPIGGRLGASAAPALEPQNNDFLDEEPTRVGSSFDFEELEAELKKEEAARDAAPVPVSAAPPSGQLPAAAPLAGPPPAGGLAPASDAFDPFASQAGANPLGAAPAPALAPVSAQPVPERRRRAIPIGAWIAIAGAMAFGVALAVMVGTHLLSSPPEVATTAPDPAGDPQPDPGPEPELALPEVPTPEEPSTGPEGTTPEPDPTAPVAEPGGTTGRRRAGGGGGRTTTAETNPRPATNNSTLTPEQRRRLEAAGEDNSLPAPIGGVGGSVLDDRGSQSGGGGSELTGDQIAAVVRRGQSQIQQCYEVEARRTGQAPSLRINARVTIGPSGTVQRVSATGGSFGNLGTCIERRVRQWHFPRSGGSTTTSMPFVFTGRD